MGLTSDAAEAKSYAAQMGYRDVPVAFTAGEMLAPNALRGVPAVLLVDANGMVRETLTGFHRGPALAADIRRVLAP